MCSRNMTHNVNYNKTYLNECGCAYKSMINPCNPNIKKKPWSRVMGTIRCWAFSKRNMDINTHSWIRNELSSRWQYYRMTKNSLHWNTHIWGKNRC